MAANSPIGISCGDVKVVMGWADFLKHLEIFAAPYAYVFYLLLIFWFGMYQDSSLLCLFSRIQELQHSGLPFLQFLGYLPHLGKHQIGK